MENLFVSKKTLGLDTIETMEPYDLVQTYDNQGLDLVLFTGEAVLFDANGKQKPPKSPSQAGWNRSGRVSALAAWQKMQGGQWIGFRVPYGFLSLDVDHKKAVDKFETQLDELIAAGYIISKTANGYHFYGKAPAGMQYATGPDSVTKDGVEVTARDGSRHCCLEQPSPDKKWITDLDWNRCPELPAEWVPVTSKKKWEKSQMKAQSAASEAEDQKVREELSKARKIRKGKFLETLVDAQVEIALRAEHGQQSNTYNAVAYTVAGAASGAHAAGIAFDEAGALQRILEAAKANCVDGDAAAEASVMSGWKAGLAAPMVMTEHAIDEAVKDSHGRVAALKNSTKVPRPGGTWTTEQSVEKAVQVLFGKYDIFRYRNQVWYAKHGCTNFALLSPTLTHDAVRYMRSWITGNISYYDFDNLVDVPFVNGMDTHIAAAVCDKLMDTPEVVAITCPAVIDGQWVDETNAAWRNDVRIIPLESSAVSCTPAESAQWIMDNIVDVAKYETEQDRGRSFSTIAAQRMKHYRSGDRTPQRPVTVWTGYQPGAGKTQQAVLAAMAGSDQKQIDVCGQFADKTEVSKHITTDLLGGTETFILDNIKGKVEGQMYETLATSPYWNARILGGNTQINWRYTMNIWLTLNGAIMSEDFTRRTSMITLIRNFDTASWSHGGEDPRTWVEDNKAEYRGHVENMMKGWVDAGCPEDNSQAGTSFCVYTRAVAGVCRFYGIDCGQIVDEEKAREETLEDADAINSALLEYIYSRYNTGEFRPADLLDNLKRDTSNAYARRSDPIISQLQMSVIIPGWERMCKFDEIGDALKSFGARLRGLRAKTKISTGQFLSLIKRRTGSGMMYSIVVYKS
jgi:hypothetical protein